LPESQRKLDETILSTSVVERQLMNVSYALLFVALLFSSSDPLLWARDALSSNSPAKLADLLAEADRNNSQIQAARHETDASKQVSTQVSSRPDPQVVLQHLSVGSPRPFAGYTNSDFAYIGLGFSQDIPYPGKLRLRGEIAKKDGEAAEQRYESVRRSVLAAVKQGYFQLGYLAEKAKILDADQELLRQVEQSAEARYRSGTVNQQDILQAQLEQTKVLRDITTNQLETDKVEAVIKQLLNRSQSSPDIESTELSETLLPYSYEQLLASANANNPELAEMQRAVEKQQLQVDLAKKDFYPDFNLQYMWQRTDPTQFRAYYMLTFSARVPIYRGRRQNPELAQAEADQSRWKNEYEAKSQQLALDLRQQFAVAEKATELLKIYREGLIPQARAELQAGMAAYQSSREDFQALLTSFLDVLKLDEEYSQTLSEHESALAEVERITGLSLP
jgi:outer membrane protein, heavy metal efflux system